MMPQWEYGDAVRVTRNVRNDGTFPGLPTGDLLVRRGAVGHVVNVGTFLVDQLIYSVHFPEAGRVVGCRAEELIDASEPWLPSRFEARDHVRAGQPLSMDGQVQVRAGEPGEVLRVLRTDGQVTCHVHFACKPGRVFAVPEPALDAMGDAHDGL